MIGLVLIFIASVLLIYYSTKSMFTDDSADDYGPAREPPTYFPEVKYITRKLYGEKIVNIRVVENKLYYSHYMPEPNNSLKPCFKYNTKGRNIKTNRIKGYIIFAYDESDAKRRANLLGLVEPLTVVYSEENTPTSKQIEAARKAEILLPSGVTRYDISNIFDVLFDKFECPVSQKTIDYVLKNDIVISPYSSESGAQRAISAESKRNKL